MDVDDVHRLVGQQGRDVVSGAGMDRQLERQPGRDPVDRQAVDDVEARAHAVVAGCRGDDEHVVARGMLAGGEGAHLHLDATEPGQVAVADVRDPHGVTVRQDDRVPATLVFLHAHPDDEALLTAGTMARAAAEGQRVVLVVATAGEAGLTAASVATAAGGLGTVRIAELQRSAAALGVARVAVLGYADSGLHGEVADGFAHRGPHDVAQRVAAILAEEGADVLVSYDPSGGYGHPDHLQVHRVGRLARDLAGSRPRLFEATLPREPIAGAARAAAALRLTPAAFDPSEFAGAWTPRSRITHRVDVRRHLGAKRAALAAHASQATADGTTRTLAVLGRLPRPLAAALLGTEYYVAVP